MTVPFSKIYSLFCLCFCLLSAKAQVVLYEKRLNGGITADGYNLRFESGDQRGQYHLSIAASAQRIEKAYLSILFTGSYFSLLPQQFEFNGSTYTITEADIKSTLFPTPYAVDEKAYIASIDVTASIHIVQEAYPFKFTNISTGASNRLTSTYLTAIYSDSAAKQIHAAIVLNNKMPSSGQKQDLTYKMPNKISNERSSVLSVWADYACKMPWNEYTDHLDIYFNKRFLGTIAGGLQDECFGSLGSFGYVNSTITPTNLRSNPNTSMDSTDALSNVSFLVNDTTTKALFEFQSDAQNISHFLCGYVYAYRTDQKGSGQCDLKSSLQLYPQPVSDYLTIRKASPCDVKLNLYNALGQLLINERQIVDGENRIQMYHLPSGVYFYDLYSGKERFSGKVMKLHRK